MNILVLDMRRILDDSNAGRAAAQQLQARVLAARAEVEAAAKAGKLDDARALEAKLGSTLDALRNELRDQVSARAQPIVQRLTRERQAQMVLERSAVLACDPALDITDIVMAEIDRAP